LRWSGQPMKHVSVVVTKIQQPGHILIYLENCPVTFKIISLLLKIFDVSSAETKDLGYFRNEFILFRLMWKEYDLLVNNWSLIKDNIVKISGKKHYMVLIYGDE
jgi:hypothetical protein